MSSMIRASVVLLFSVCFFGSAWAGQLDPRLAGLTIGGHAFVRVTATGAVATRQPINPMLPRVRADGAVQVYIRPATPGGQLPSAGELAAVGATGIRSSAALGVVQAWVPIQRLNDLANLPGVGLVTVPSYGVVPRPIRRNALNGVRPAAASASVPTGLAIDQDAVQAMQADQLQTVGATGAGVKVGIISNNNSGLAASQAAGYLPATVWADPNFPGTSGADAEGTAMLEEVHAMTPGASLGFCGPQTTVDFLTCYNDFASWGANIIADDLGFPGTDYFSIGNTADQSFAYAIASFTQAHRDIAITSSAGNDGYDYFEAPYTPGPGATIGGITYPSLMDFGAAVGGSGTTQLSVLIWPSASIMPVLEWNDPVNTSPDNLVLYLVNGSGTVLAQGTTFQAFDGRIGAFLSYTANSSGETDYLEVACQSCSNPITIKLSGQGNGAAEFGIYTYGSENAGQKVANGVMATAAAWVATQSPLSINREAFSGTGPFLYGDFGAISAIAKPDLTGIDDVLVSGAGGFGIPLSSGGALFCGTSATSPNVGALIAALMQADPGKGASYYYSALQQTADQTDFTAAASGGPCFRNVPSTTGYSQSLAGSGLAQGYAALASFYSFPSTSITQPVSVASGQTGTVTVPVNVNITYSASVQSGSNPATASNCQWTANGVVPQTGASVIYFATAAGTFQIVVNCPDSHGIKSPTPPGLTVSAQNIPAPTAAISNASSSGFNLTLTGYEPLTVSATSSNTSVLSDSGIAISPSNCGTSTLSCTVSLNPVIHANGTTTVTITTTDQWSRSASTQQSETYTYTPPSSGGGGGGFGWLGILGLLLLSGLTVLTKR